MHRDGGKLAHSDACPLRLPSVSASSPCARREGNAADKLFLAMTEQPRGLALVSLLSPPYADLSYSLPAYLPPGAFSVGQRVLAPLGKSLRAGIVRSFAASLPEQEDAVFVIKNLLWPLEKEPMLSSSYLDLIQQLANRQSESFGRILGSVMPAGLRGGKFRLRFFNGPKPLELQLKDLRALPFERLEELGRLWQEGKAELVRSGLSPLDAEICRLAQDPPWPVRPAAKAQTAMLEYLFEHGSVTRRKLGEDLGKGAPATLTTLASRGLVRICPADSFDEAAGCASSSAANEGAATPSEAVKAACLPFALTRQQEAAYEALLGALHSGKAETRLLFGITGSGKTAIFLELVRSALQLGKSALLLAPEVALALKLRADVEAALPTSCISAENRLLYHGYMSPAARERVFRKAAARKGSPLLVVGTRSALLLPLDNTGLIVLDEEHDASFKQDEGLNYQAKEVAWYKAQTGKSLLLLASATPDVKSFYAAKQGALPMHVLSERVGGGSLPEVKLVQLGKSAPSPQEGRLLAPESLELLKEVVGRGEQAVIMLNRRGYAPLMYCRSCSKVAKCPHCDISLAYHKGRERLVCHYCGYSSPYPSPCLLCGGMQFQPMGEGTEKLEESLAEDLPSDIRVLRLDRDSTRRPGRMEEILNAFARKEASVLVGTQMLSKGHHFPDVTLAVVADADLGLNLPDYRAAERTFQLLLQSAGRSGRGEKAGTVIIQTRDPGHYCWEYVIKADYEGFYERELALRQKRKYPPFVNLALIRVSHAIDAEDGPGELAALAAFLRTKARESSLTILGPAPAPLHVLKGQKRFQCLLKGQNWQDLRSLYMAAVDKMKKSSLSLRLDLDPLSMM